MTISDKSRRNLEALVEADGVVTDAARIAGINQSSMSLAMKTTAEREKLPYPGKQGGKTYEARDARVRFAQIVLARHPRRVTSVAPVKSERVAPISPAVCHADREEFSSRLCRECYAERVERSRALVVVTKVARLEDEPEEDGPDSALEDLIKVRRALTRAVPLARKVIDLASELEHILDGEA